MKKKWKAGSVDKNGILFSQGCAKKRKRLYRGLMAGIIKRNKPISQSEMSKESK